ncbi:hypothetical protein C3B79_2765 [Aeromonas hydrophila]|nr:hypothetical protein C3B79_2765 [Aeromonas hydrophila]
MCPLPVGKVNPVAHRQPPLLDNQPACGGSRYASLSTPRRI